MAERLLSPERERWADSAVVLKHLQVGPGDLVADIGCGPGYFTVKLARSVAPGRVYALDVDDEMLELCRGGVAQAGLGNVVVQECGEYEFGLEEGSLDLVFLSCVIHHAEDQVRFLKAARRLLKPLGRCAMLEWEARDSEMGPPLERRIDRDRLIRHATAAGFVDCQLHHLSQHQYLLLAGVGT